MVHSVHEAEQTRAAPENENITAVAWGSIYYLSVKAMMKKNSMAFEEKQTNKQTAPLGATKYEKRNDQCFIVLKLALELSKYRYRGYLFVFKIYCSNFILEFQIICLFYLTDEN